MKTLGLIGGTTWVSTLDYYRHINKEVNNLLSGHNSAKLVLYSFNFQELVSLQDKNDYEGFKGLLLNAAKALSHGGIDGIMLCANTLHKYADAVEEAAGIPLIHIADETASEIKKSGFKTVGLLGTKTTMGEAFYKDKLRDHGITAIVPGEREQEYIHRAIFDELGKDIFKDDTRQELLRIMQDLQKRGAEGIILGCTEIPLIIKPEHTSIPMFDTLVIHAGAGARFVVSH